MYNLFILQNLAFIYDIENMLRYFITEEGRYLDSNRLGILFPTRVPEVSGRHKTRRDETEITGEVLTNLEQVRKVRNLDAKSISGHVPHSALRPVIKHVFECLTKDAGQCTAKEVRV